jgi:hypothetical protein
MPDPSELQLEPLRQAFRDVAFRSNRVGEWIDLEPYLRNLDASFGEFCSEVRLAVGPPPRLSSGRIRKLRDLWSRCRSTDFTDLKSFASGAIYLNQQLVPGAGGNPGPHVSVWVTDLATLADKLEESINQGNYNELAQYAQKFQQTLNGQIADRRNFVRKEVRDLCDLTILLKNQLNA